ncbi:transcription-repair coupling factor [Arcticibacterium luteifluviistationis]|uniref:Transcription-repair-coupling factor n=1 Tax=Arcticibacterium luteifluviistationis TaxID=1784714 RepID=A0A2Z4GFB5_9BACT|nr:transcription-repair coupling factor [Arcticibacterium luteifluviistationis]AWV99747.1 transcription-repair coupling factor [Arcticibacterium luteifluviistationis]
MVAEEFLKIFQEDSFVQNIAEQLKDSQRVQIEGLHGSLDAVLAASFFKKTQYSGLFILPEKEDAAYFYNDLRNLLGEENVFYFPASYKRLFEYQEIENANVLLRAELINKLNQGLENALIVSYSEALTEKVINKKSLVANTLKLRSGETLDLNFITELLVSYDFEKTDFVYEPGQFSVRGGIVDIFSFASDKPVRLELWGDEIDTMRFFDPETQLSIKTLEEVTIIPDVEHKLKKEERESFFGFLPKDSQVWVKDVNYCLEIAKENFERATLSVESMVEKSGDIQVVFDADESFLTKKLIKEDIEKFKTIEFGRRFFYNHSLRLNYPSKSQPSFNKEFKLLINDISERQSKGFSTVICSDQSKQLTRLKRIFEELDPQNNFIAGDFSLREGFVDQQAKMVCYTDHQIFERYHRYNVKEKFSKSKAITIKELKSLKSGDFVTHIDYGIGRFAGMEFIDVKGRKQEAIRLIYKDNDLLFVNIHSLHKIAKYSGKEGLPPPMSKLGTGDWETKKSKVKRQVKDIAKELIALYAKRRAAPGFAFSEDTYLQIELESSFLYDDTPDQAKATADVKEDMEKPNPMDRLVCGDVGFGKTEIAIRAAFKAVADGKQAAVLVPTTILAMQHAKTFRERLEKLPVTVDYLNRFKSAAESTKTLKELKAGKVDIIIGTHRLLNKKIEFKDLGLLVIDEEQKFGVKAKDRIKEIKHNVDVLTLTATPIPRTLHFSLMGARDLSIIATPPPNRQPVTTEVKVFQEEVLRDALSYELQRGGQAFFVHNRIKDIDSIGSIIMRLVPDAKIGVAHGQMDGDKLEKIMMSFIEGDIDILISTNIIESGLDIPNANTIIINHAHMFGMSDLHQMRGRVGRSNKKAFCYLLTPPLSGLTRDSRKRLQTLEEFSDLGDGFKVAMRDLDIRGAGNLLGAEQSGFVNDLGYELYHKILDDAVSELKENEFKSLFEKELSAKEFKVEDCQIETDQQILIPDSYITNISERLSVYNSIDGLKTQEELDLFKASIHDRFGKLPKEVEDLFEIVRIRWKAETLGFEKITWKNNILKAYFVSSKHVEYYQADKFGRILDYVKVHPKKCTLKQIKEKLVLSVQNADSIQKIETFFDSVLEHIDKKQ